MQQFIAQGKVSVEPVEIKNGIRFGISVGRGYKSPHSGRYIFDLFFVVCYGKRAEYLRNKLGKGTWVILSGTWTMKRWTHQDGTDRYIYQILGDNVMILTSSDADKDKEWVEHDFQISQGLSAMQDFAAITEEEADLGGNIDVSET